MIGNVNKKIREKLAGRLIRQAARISTEPVECLKVVKPVGHVKSNVISLRIPEPRITTGNLSNASMHSF